MIDRSLPEGLEHATGYASHHFQPVDGFPRVWLLTTEEGVIVVRACGDERDPVWLHQALDDLSKGFPVPSPIGIFGGRSVWRGADSTWEALSYVPGTVIGFDPVPPLEAVGAFLAEFHLASLSLGDERGARHRGAPLQQLEDLARTGSALNTLGRREKAAWFETAMADFAERLGDSPYGELARCVIHGDPTTFNMVALGDPPEPSGLIDFELADMEAPVADIAFGLIRTGRASQESVHLDMARVGAFVAGYNGVRPLEEADVELLPLCLEGRGLQMVVKRIRRGVAFDGSLDRLTWIIENRANIAATVRAAVRSK